MSFRKRVRTIGLYAAFGLVMTIAVAWFCAVGLVTLGRITPLTRAVTPVEAQPWPVTMPPLAGATATLATVRIPGKTSVMAFVTQSDPPDDTSVVSRHWCASEWRFGVPWTTLRVVQRFGTDSPRSGGLPRFRGDAAALATPLERGIRLQVGAAGGYVLPTQPMWGPFVLSVAGWGAAGGALSRALRSMVVRRRRWRGLCVGCGYELGTAAGCAECGRPRTMASSAGPARRHIIRQLTAPSSHRNPAPPLD